MAAVTAFADMTPYSYAESDEPMVNVGWLGGGVPFPRGPAGVRMRAGGCTGRASCADDRRGRDVETYDPDRREGRSS